MDLTMTLFQFLSERWSRKRAWGFTLKSDFESNFDYIYIKKEKCGFLCN